MDIVTTKVVLDSYIRRKIKDNYKEANIERTHDTDEYITDGINTLVMRINNNNKKVEIPNVIDGVIIKTLAPSALNYSNVTTVVIPEGVEAIQ